MAEAVEVGCQPALATAGQEGAPSRAAWEAPPVTAGSAALAAEGAPSTAEAEAGGIPGEVAGCLEEWGAGEAGHRTREATRSARLE